MSFLAILFKGERLSSVMRNRMRFGGYCCSDMQYHANRWCEQPKLQDGSKFGVSKPHDKWECGDFVMHSPKPGVFGIPVHDGGSSHIEIRYCPWCSRHLSAYGVRPESHALKLKLRNIPDPEELADRIAEKLKEGMADPKNVERFIAAADLGKQDEEPTLYRITKNGTVKLEDPVPTNTPNFDALQIRIQKMAQDRAEELVDSTYNTRSTNFLSEDVSYAGDKRVVSDEEPEPEITESVSSPTPLSQNHIHDHPVDTGDGPTSAGGGTTSRDPFEG